MIPRYSSPQVDALFSEEAKMARWLEIELVVTEELAAEGVVDAAHAAACRASAPVVDAAFVGRVEEREAVTNHDVAAFVDVVQAAVGAPAGAWIHYGLTSTDVVDTGLCWALRDAADLVISAQTELLRALVATARQHAGTAMIGRTHGIHAEPTTFGAKVALWALQVDRDRSRMRAARQAVAVCKLSGAVGTYSNIPPAVETRVAARLGLAPVPATQVIARDRHAEYLWACASAGTTLEMIAVELRHLQRTEVGEVREGFAKGQKGSSAMPHKRNPISAETISGLSRVLRGNLQVGLQDVPLWHERDISHSSAERIVLPDSTSLVYYMTRRMTSLLSNLEVDTDRMLANLDMLHGVVYSQSVLLAMVSAGMLRDDAYRIVQECAARAIQQGAPFRDVLTADPRVTVSGAELDAAFDLARVLKDAGRGIAALDSLEL
ncbi:MAG: adenylosuccinate lyase [Actinomycetota bacterium]